MSYLTLDKVYCIIGMIFLLEGIWLRTGKGNFLLLFFVRNMKEKKERYDMKRLRAFVAHAAYLCALAWGIMALGAIVSIKYIIWGGILLFMLVVVYSGRYTEQAENFEKDGEDRD